MPRPQHEHVHLTVADADPVLLNAGACARTFGFGEGRFCYAGLHVDHPGGALIVFRVPNGTFDRQVRDVVGAGVTVIFQEAAHPRIELEAARDQVWDLPGSENIVGVSVPADGSTLKVTFDGDVLSAQAWLNVMLPGLVTVTAMGGAPVKEPAVAGEVPDP
jgi:hypothetical protein